MIQLYQICYKKWIKLNDFSSNLNDLYCVNKNIKFKTSILRSYLCDYSDIYIVVKWTITVEGGNNALKKEIKN